jgi:hypothetical protein
MAVTDLPKRTTDARPAALAARLGAVVAAALALSGCQAIGTIFEAGMWVGIIAVIAVVAVVAVIASMFRR